MSTMPQNNKKALPKTDAGDHNLVRVVEAAWQALKAANDPPFMFRYGDFLAQIDFDTEGDRVVRRLGQDSVRHFLAQAAWWYRIKKGIVFDALPPLHVVRDFLVAPDNALPVLTRIVKAPVFASDGSLHVKAGYNAVSRSFYAPANGLKIPVVSQNPSPNDVSTALTLITQELLGDFPFVGDAERASAVALLLLPFARDLIAGATPLHLIEKPSPGTGATLLADMLT